MKKSNKIYEELSKKYTDEEIVEGFVFNESLSASEQKEVDEELKGENDVNIVLYSPPILERRIFGMNVYCRGNNHVTSLALANLFNTELSKSV